MLLIQMKNYLKQKHLVNLLELSSHFKVEPDIVKDMMKLFMRKGQIKQKARTNQCGIKCVKCPSVVTELYEWIGA